jgi:ketosteroid isomerase-like protein
MSEEQSKTVVLRFYNELWNERNLNVADEIFAVDCLTHQLQSGAETLAVVRNPETVKHHVAEWLSGFPDLRFTVEQILVEGERVMTQSVMHGSHTGVWLGVAPTNKEVSIRLSVIHRIVDGKIVEDWVLVEALGFFQQLGLVPPTQEIFAQTAS